jgi:DNA recombination protein RmuC
MAIEALLYVILVILLLVLWKLFNAKKENKTLAILEEKHRQMLLDINDSLNKQSDRFNKTVSDELLVTRESLQNLQLSQQESLAKIRQEVIEKLHKTLSEQGKSQQDSLQKFFKKHIFTVDEFNRKSYQIG